MIAKSSSGLRNLNIDGQIFFNKSEQCLGIHLVRCNDTLISLCIHNDDLFVKFIESKKVKSTITATGGNPFVICVCNSQPQGGSNHMYRFSICHSLDTSLT